MSDYPKQESSNPIENQFSARIISQLSPHKYKFTEYFEQKGISKNLIHQNTAQIYYQYEGKKYLGVAIPNHSGGF
ncbi:hypothetical protein [Chryseobacterium sp. 7]|uniref:hypothetical protein n=1 Tax=Chryseobacterium sp. 7 TaxID=2035214 RepID=UPI0011C41BE1|nr:hypothetical protein [Chryseobacterium sp. 7]